MKLFLSILVTTIITAQLLAQTTQYFNYEQALINDNVRSIEEDNSGNIWIGTIGGITKFDGLSFTSYTTADGLGGNIVYDICVHSSGDIYAATSGGLSVFNGSTWTNYASGDGLPSSIIWSVAEDNDNQIWVGTSAAGVAYFDGTNWFPYSVSDGLIAAGVKVAFCDRSGNMWFGTGNGLSIFDGTEFKNYNTSTGLPGLMINEIIQLYNGNIAIATNGGVGIYNYQSWTNITTAQGLPTASVLSIKEDFDQNLWLGCSLGLVKYDGTSFTTINYNNGLTNNIVTKHIITHAGDNKIWCASPFNGVTVFDQNQNYVIYRTNRNLVSDEVNTVYVDDDRISWVGTKGGLNRVSDNHWRTYKVADGLSNDDITSIHKDINDNIWVGTQSGLNKIVGPTITKILVANGLTNPIVNGITSNPAGIVYVATPNKVTVIQNGIVTDTISTVDGLLSNNVQNIHYENGRLWFLMDVGIQYYDGVSYFNMTPFSCSELQTASKAVCQNSPVEQYFGTDYSLRYFQMGIATADCYLHPYSGTSVIQSIVDSDLGQICSFANGEVQIFNSIWTPYPMPYDVSFLASEIDNYLWVGFTNDGLAKICTNCNTAITYNKTSPTCHDINNGNVTITSPVGAYNYSVNNGNNWQASPVFTNQAGGYKHIIVRNALGDFIADSLIYLNYYDDISDANITISQINCNGDNNGNIVLEYSNPGSHEWENGNTVLLTRASLDGGNYSVTVSDAGSCSRILETEIIEPSLLNVTASHLDVTCFGLLNGSVSLTVSGGTLPYEFQWNVAGTTNVISGLADGTYSYTVTDAKGCQILGSQLITEPGDLLIQSSIIDNLCFGNSNGSVDITVNGGTTPFAITWSDPAHVNVSNDIVNAPADTYLVTVTDSNLCQELGSFEITEPAELEIISEDLIHVHCFGESTGEIDIEVAGGIGSYTYEWIKQGLGGIFSTDQDLVGLENGVYYLTIADQNNCETLSSYTISQSPELFVNLDVTPITCAGYNDGSILAVATGGTGIYSAYYWYNEAEEVIGVDENISGLSEGYYEVVVRDSYYCYDTASTTLTQAVPHVYTISATPMSCNGLEDGQIVVTVDGGSGSGFDFVWQDAIAGNTNIAEGLGEGTFSVSISDPTNCTEILSETIIQPLIQDIGVFEDVAYICYGNSLILNPGAFVSYLWSTGDLSPTIEVINEDVYIVNVVASNGCHLSDTVEVLVSAVYNDESINLATVTDAGKVKVLWEKTPGQGTASYNIYRNDGDSFEFLASKEYSEVAIFEDLNVNTTSQYYEYQITSVDSCGAESDYSNLHRTCRLEVVPNINGACYLNWGEYQGFFVVYYFIMSGTSPDNLTVVDSVLYNDFNWVEMNQNPEGTYYRIKVRRIDGCSPGDGNYYDAAYSNIVFCDNYTGIVNSAVSATSVYPNPFANEINIDFNLNLSENVNIYLTNLLGQDISILQDQYLEAGQQTLSFTPDIEPGIYFLKIKVANEVFNYKLIKN
jgi:ligand-binding sensor domain-containing protein